MQRMIEATIIKKILDKYQERYNECQNRWNDDYRELQETHFGELQWKDHQRRKYLTEDMQANSMQLDIYECIVKDLKELIK